MRSNWQKRFVPVNVKCDGCGSTKVTHTKYGTPKQVKNRQREGGYLCRPCYTTQRNKSRDYSSLKYRNNLKLGIHRALDSGVIFGRRIYTINETVLIEPASAV